MGKACEICGKGPDFGQSISHSHKATKRKRKPNLHRIKVKTDSGEQRIWICSRCIRSGVVKKAL